MSPDELGGESGKAQHETLGGERDLEVAMIGGQLSAAGVPVGVGAPVQELITGAAAQGDHGTHPEAIRPSAEQVQGVFEGELDFEPQGVGGDDRLGGAREIGGEQQKATADGRDDGDNAHAYADGAPEEIAHRVLENEAGFIIGRTGPGVQGPANRPASFSFLP